MLAAQLVAGPCVAKSSFKCIHSFEWVDWGNACRFFFFFWFLRIRLLLLLLLPGFSCGGTLPVFPLFTFLLSMGAQGFLSPLIYRPAVLF